MGKPKILYMETLKINIERTKEYVSQDELTKMEQKIKPLIESVYNKTGKGNDFLGWVDLPVNLSSTIVDSIEKSAKYIQSCSDIHVVIGIGGSYLGARAVIDALSNNFSHLLDKSQRKFPYIVYAGNNIGEEYLSELIEVLDKKDYSISVISKSGTTTEPAIAFRILKSHIENKYGKAEAQKRIIAITDQSRGALKKLADKEGYTSYVIPDDVGGRYSVLTPVGLLPIAIAGFDIKKLLEGAKYMRSIATSKFTLNENPVAMYAAVRNVLYSKGKNVEILANYLPALHYITEWWKQLYGESEGKENKGIFPAGVDFTSDLHSMGQYIQEGQRFLFETVLSVEKSRKQLLIPTDAENADGLNFIAGKNIHDVNKIAELGTAIAHQDGGVPNISISIPVLNEEYIGQLLYFFELACAVSGYMIDVNPFDQPGVEAYKNNMFALLGKPGFEKQTEEIKKKLK